MFYISLKPIVDAASRISGPFVVSFSNRLCRHVFRLLWSGPNGLSEAKNALGTRAMPRDDLDLFHIAAALGACLVAAGLYKWMGFFGVAILGMFVLFVATNVDLEDGRSLGNTRNISLFAQQMTSEDSTTHSKRAALKSERKRRRRSTDYAMAIGGAFLLVGGLGFFFLQLHLGR